MKIYFTAIILVLQVTLTRAQENTLTVPEFGEVSIAELQMKKCDFSPEAPTVNLLKYREVKLTVFPNGNTEVVTGAFQIFAGRGMSFTFRVKTPLV